MEKNFNIILCESELNYVKGALNGLIEIQKRLPKKFKTKNSELLYQVYNKLEDIN